MHDTHTHTHTADDEQSRNNISFIFLKDISPITLVSDDNTVCKSNIVNTVIQQDTFNILGIYKSIKTIVWINFMKHGIAKNVV